MRTTLNIDDALLEKAKKATGVSEKTRLLHLGLEAIIQQTAARELAEMGGSDQKAAFGTRRKANP